MNPVSFTYILSLYLKVKEGILSTHCFDPSGRHLQNHIGHDIRPLESGSDPTLGSGPVPPTEGPEKASKLKEALCSY